MTFIKAGHRPPSYIDPAMDTEVIDVDARGLEPPQPMVRILEALATLPSGRTLRARTDRRPVHLNPLIEERGFRADTQPESDGSFVTHIRHA